MTYRRRTMSAGPYRRHPNWPITSAMGEVERCNWLAQLLGAGFNVRIGWPSLWVARP